MPLKSNWCVSMGLNTDLLLLVRINGVIVVERCPQEPAGEPGAASDTGLVPQTPPSMC